jgi:hypothetical protein
MAQWGRNDQSVTANSVTTVETSNGAPIGTYALVKGDQVNRVNGANAHFGNTSAGSRASVDVNMFGNTTLGAFIPGVAVGVFGVDAAEAGVSSGNLASAVVTSGGSGYSANAVVTLTFANGSTNATAVNAFANVTAGVGGSITSLLIAQPGSGYTVNPTVTIAAPSLIVFNGNTAVDATADTITITAANSKFQAGDLLTYAGNTLSTPGGLTDGTKYYVSFANTTVIALSATLNGSNVNLTKASGDGTTAAGATIRGETATGYVVVGGAKNRGVTHAGWVLRTEGTGGRAGRVQYETLVAMGSLGAQTAAYGTPANVADAGDDARLPDS